MKLKKLDKDGERIATRERSLSWRIGDKYGG